MADILLFDAVVLSAVVVMLLVVVVLLTEVVVECTVVSFLSTRVDSSVLAVVIVVVDASQLIFSRLTLTRKLVFCATD